MRSLGWQVRCSWVPNIWYSTGGTLGDCGTSMWGGCILARMGLLGSVVLMVLVAVLAGGGWGIGAGGMAVVGCG